MILLEVACVRSDLVNVCLEQVALLLELQDQGALPREHHDIRASPLLARELVLEDDPPMLPSRVELDQVLDAAPEGCERLAPGSDLPCASRPAHTGECVLSERTQPFDEINRRKVS